MKFLVEYLLHNARLSPDRRALAYQGEALRDNEELTWQTWNDIATATAATANWLLQQKIEPESIVVSCMPNSLPWIALDLACQAIGAVHAPIEPRFPIELIVSLIELAKPCAVIASAQTLKGTISQLIDAPVYLFASPQSVPNSVYDFCLANSRGRPDLSDLFSSRRHSEYEVVNVLFTSGTTDSPKGVMLTHRNLVSNARGKLAAMPQSSLDRRLNFLPFSHSYARTCELSTWLMTGGELVLAPSMRDMPEWSRRFAPSLINGVPLFFDNLRRDFQAEAPNVNVKRQLGGNIRQLASGGAALNGETSNFFTAAQLPILVGYGLTEASPVVCSNVAGLESQFDVGPPIPGVSVRIDRDGQLWIKGNGVMKGYLHDTTATDDVLVNGELRTGDLAEMDSQGRIRLLGRQRDTIVLSSGVKVSPYSVERQLKQVIGVEEAIVLGDGSDRCVGVLVVSTQLWSDLKQDRGTCDRLSQELLMQLASFPKYAIPAGWVVRRSPFVANDQLVNRKGSPRRDIIRLQYETVWRESIRSGTHNVWLDDS